MKITVFDDEENKVEFDSKVRGSFLVLLPEKGEKDKGISAVYTNCDGYDIFQLIDETEKELKQLKDRFAKNIAGDLSGELYDVFRKNLDNINDQIDELKKENNNE